jgi:hypothetical protein
MKAYELKSFKSTKMGIFSKENWFAPPTFKEFQKKFIFTTNQDNPNITKVTGID